jgi:protease-4
MRQFIKSFFASFLAIIAVIVLMIAIFTGMFIGTLSSLGSKSKTIVNKNSILLIDLDHTYSDNATSNSIAALLSEDADKPSIYQVTESIKKAGTDNNIEGIYIKMGDPELGKANLSQFRDALLEFKKSNKFIYAYGENISQSAYYIATVADSIFMNPHGGLSFQGLSSQILFFKGLLDKLEIKPEIFYAGKFKSATEPFRLEQASPENKEQLAKLQETIWEDYMAAVHMKTGLDNEQINDLVNNFKIQFPQDAVTYKLIDGLRYKDEVIASLLTKLKVDEESDLNMVALNDYAMNMEQTSKASDRIAILVAEGSIVDGKAEDEGVIASEDFVKE